MPLLKNNFLSKKIKRKETLKRMIINIIPIKTSSKNNESKTEINIPNKILANQETLKCYTSEEMKKEHRYLSYRSKIDKLFGDNSLETLNEEKVINKFEVTLKVWKEDDIKTNNLLSNKQYTELQRYGDVKLLTLFSNRKEIKEIDVLISEQDAKILERCTTRMNVYLDDNCDELKQKKTSEFNSIFKTIITEYRELEKKKKTIITDQIEKILLHLFNDKLTEITGINIGNIKHCPIPSEDKIHGDNEITIENKVTPKIIPITPIKPIITEPIIRKTTITWNSKNNSSTPKNNPSSPVEEIPVAMAPIGFTLKDIIYNIPQIYKDNTNDTLLKIIFDLNSSHREHAELYVSMRQNLVKVTDIKEYTTYIYNIEKRLWCKGNLASLTDDICNCLSILTEKVNFFIDKTTEFIKKTSSDNQIKYLEYLDKLKNTFIKMLKLTGSSGHAKAVAVLAKVKMYDKTMLNDMFDVTDEKLEEELTQKEIDEYNDLMDKFDKEAKERGEKADKIYEERDKNYKLLKRKVSEPNLSKEQKIALTIELAKGCISNNLEYLIRNHASTLNLAKAELDKLIKECEPYFTREDTRQKKEEKEKQDIKDWWNKQIENKKKEKHKRTVKFIDKLDANPYIVSIRGGKVITITKEKIEVRDRRKEDYCTFEISTEWDRYADQSIIDQLFDDIFLGDRRLVKFMQLVLGSYLIGRPIKYFFIFHSRHPHSSKSLIMGIMEKLFEQYHLVAHDSVYIQTKTSNDKGSDPFQTEQKLKR